MNVRIFILFIIVIILPLPFFCTMPTDDNALSWYAKYTVPLLNTKLVTQDILLENETLSSIFKTDSMQVGDTLHIEFSDTFSSFHRSVLFQCDDIYLKKSFEIPGTQNIPEIPCIIPIVDIGFPSFPLPKPVSATLKGEVTIPYFDYLIIDKSSDSIVITMKNLSDGCTFRKICPVLICDGAVIATFDTITTLVPGQKVHRSLSLAGKKITDHIEASLTVELAEGSVVTTGPAVGIYIDLNNQKLAEAAITDIYLDYSFSYAFTLPLTRDTFQLDYFDLQSLRIPLYVKNATPITFTVSAIVGNIFDNDYCKKKNITTLQDLENQAIDSAYFLGNTLSPMVIQGTGNTGNPVNADLLLSLENARILPEWNTESLYSSIPVVVKGRISQTNKKIVIVNKSLGVGVLLYDPVLEFSEIQGQYAVDKHIRGKAMPLMLPFQNISALFEKLRNRFKIVRTNVDFSISFDITGHTMISGIDYACVFQQPTNPQQPSDTLFWQMDTIAHNSSFSYHYSLGNLINSFPDSLCYLLNQTFPRNRKMTFGKEAIHNKPNLSYLEIISKTSLDMRLFLIWEISDTIRTSLQDIRTPLMFTKQQIKSLENMSLRIDYTLFNQTNLHGRLFALGSDAVHKERLMTLTPEEIRPDIIYTEKGARLIPMLGDSGIVLPERNNAVKNRMKIPQSALHDFVHSDSIFIRWDLLLPPTQVDALRDTDYVFIDAALTLEGVQSTESINGK